MMLLLICIVLPGSFILFQNSYIAFITVLILKTCTLIIATYNWPQALELCLKSVAEQKVLPTEVIIADDGSKQETTLLVKQFQQNFPVPLKHIWHPDEGFRLAAIRNKGILAANTDYIIQIDGDLILHPYFISDHLDIRKEGYFVTGSRVLLTPESTERLIKNESTDIKKWADTKKNWVNGIRNRLLRNFLSSRYKSSGRHLYYVKGCNMAFWKQDLIKVNGYNEAFTGWGREDSEIAIRLMNAGIKKQFIKMGGVCYHLYHNEASRDMETKNIAMMEEAIKTKITQIKHGLNKHLNQVGSTNIDLHS
jgi:glycosyltransferase involved in cell wall biosynthesis